MKAEDVFSFMAKLKAAGASPEVVAIALEGFEVASRGLSERQRADRERKRRQRAGNPQP